MQVVSTSPLRVGSLVWQPWPRVWAQSIICKATFLLAPGTSHLADVQEEPIDDDGFWDDDPQRSLYAPSDLVPVKPRADVLLVGHAFAPGGRPVRSLVARFVVGDVDKRIEVWCDRVFWNQGQVLEAQPFAKMPLRYERAAGGPGTWNPVGMRHDALPDAHGAVRIPNLQAVGAIVNPGQPMATVGFGPIAPMWLGRYEKSAGLAGERWHERVLPQGMDHGYFNAAPWDQQLPGIRPDERIVLENLHPVYETLETRLPGIVPRALVRGPTREAAEEVPLVADTLWIDTDRGIVTVVWRGRIKLNTPEEAGEVVVCVAGFGEPEWPAPKNSDAAAETQMVQVTDMPTLPFGPMLSPWAKNPLADAPALKPVAPRRPSGTSAPAAALGRGDLPFEAKAPIVSYAADLAVVAAPIVAINSPMETEPLKPVEVAPPARLDVVVVPQERQEKPKELPLEEYPLERCAAITASIARRKSEKKKILEEYELELDIWEKLDAHWRNEIKRDVSRGRRGMLEAYDKAYIAQLEKERGPIGVEEYARLVVASERGNLGEVLDEMTLPRGAMIRIERVWMCMLSSNSSLHSVIGDKRGQMR